MIVLAVASAVDSRVVAPAVIAVVVGILFFALFWKAGERRGFWKGDRMEGHFMSLLIASVGMGCFAFMASSSLIADPKGAVASAVDFMRNAYQAMLWRQGGADRLMTYIVTTSVITALAVLAYLYSMRATARRIEQVKPVADKIEEGMARLEAEERSAQAAPDAPPASAASPVERVSAGASAETPDPEPYYGSSCAICQADVERGDEFVVCLDCGAAYHWVCARDQGGCSKEGCDSVIWMFPTKAVRRWHDVISPAGRLFGEKCGVCREIIEPYDDIAVCVECSVGYHLPCLRGSPVCPNQGCDSFAFVYPEGKVKSWRELV